MQFREQGKKIQCIRATYDTGTKRTQQSLVATFDREATEVPSAGLEDFKPDELDQLAGWFENRKQAMKVAIYKDRIDGATVNLGFLVEAIASQGITEDRAGRILDAMKLVEKAIKKAGHKKPAGEPKQASVPPGQQSLLAGEPTATAS